MKKILILFIVVSFQIFSNGHILMYHRIGDERHPTTNVSTETFIKQLDYLESNGYEVVELSKMMKEMEEEGKLPKNWVVITIDDAYKSFYENGMPILIEKNYPFTLFVNTEAVEKAYGDFMTWEMVKDAKNHGEIGGHSHTHASLPNIPFSEAKIEIEKSKKLLEENLDIKLKYFAYPYGEYSSEVKEIVANNGYEAGFKQVMGAVSYQSDRYAINRIPVGENTNLGFYLNMKYLPVRWKNVEIEDNILKWIDIELAENDKKVEVFLSGYGWEWKDVIDGRVEIEKTFKRKKNNLIIRNGKQEYNDYLILR